MKIKMKRLMNSKSGRKSYGPKWQNARSGSDSESEEDDHIHSSPAKSTATAQSPNRTGQDVALELVEKNNVLATMAKEEGTALHVLAQLDISNIISSTWRFRLLQILFGLDVTDGKKPSNFVKLAEKLWTEMQKIGKNSLMELIKKQPILHDAAKAGHVELLTMLTRTYPQLILDTDNNGHTVFHIAVKYRQLRVFNLIHSVEAMVHSRLISPDQDGNNILHLAAKVSAGLVNKTKLPPFLVLQSELAWFEVTKATVPPSCLEVRNADGLTPRELFSKEHKRLLRDSKAWMMNSADSYMLIATIVFSVLFAGAFSLPGGYDSQTGKAILSESNFFRCELIGLACSVISILLFRSIMISSFAEDDFRYNLPFKMFIGFQILLVSLILAVTAFMSSFELVSRKFDHVAMWHARAILYLACYIWVFRDYGTLVSSILNMPRKSNRSSRHTLFYYHPTG